MKYKVQVVFHCWDFKTLPNIALIVLGPIISCILMFQNIPNLYYSTNNTFNQIKLKNYNVVTTKFKKYYNSFCQAVVCKAHGIIEILDIYIFVAEYTEQIEWSPCFNKPLYDWGWKLMQGN